MAKRKSSDGEALNLDSLMDALTNVVAVLILVLLLVNADATNTIVKYIEGLEPATPEELQQSKAMLENLLQQKKDAQDIFKKPPPTPEEIEAAKRRLVKLQADIKIKGAELTSISELRQQLVVAEADRDKEKEIVVTLQKEIETMKSQLDNTNVEEPKDNIVQDIKIPEVKNVPDDAEIFYVYIRGTRFALFDHKAIIDEIEKEWAPKRKDFVIDKTTIKGKDKKSVEIDVHDIPKTREFLKGVAKNLKSNTMNVNVQIHVADFAQVPSMELTINGEQGLDVKILDEPQNPFAEALRKISNIKNAVVYFRLDDHANVAKDSFLTYQKAREYVDKKFPKIPVGWGIIVDDHTKNRRENSIFPNLNQQLFTLKPMATPPPQREKKPSQGPTPPPMKKKLG